jgi:hypothetical protein
MRAFIGVMMAMGLLKKPTIESYFLLHYKCLAGTDFKIFCDFFIVTTIHRQLLQVLQNFSWSVVE